MCSYGQLSEFDLLLDLDISKNESLPDLNIAIILVSFITPQPKLWSGSCSQTDKQTNRGKNIIFPTSLAEVITMTCLSNLFKIYMTTTYPMNITV